MSNMKTDRQMVAEAKRIIDGIVSHQKSTDQKLSNFEKQVDDLKKAQRLMTEAVQQAPISPVGGDYRLKSFVEDDGKVRWSSKVRKVKVPGKGTITQECEGLLDAKTPANDWHADLQAIARKRAFARMLMVEPHTPKSDLELFHHMQKAPSSLAPSVQRSFYDAAGQGAEWIPDEFIPDLYQTFEIPRTLRALLPSVEVDRNTILIPRLARGGRPYAKGQVSTDSPANYQASTVETAQKSVSIKGLATRYVIDDAAAEDSAIALMPTLSRQIAQDLEDGFEDCLINGNTSLAGDVDDYANWNIRSRWGSTGLGTASDHRKLFIGLRHQAFDRSSTDSTGTTFTFASLVTAMSKMGELAVQDRVMVVSPEFLIKHLLDLDEVQTLDKFGPAATILTGQLASVAGMPVVMSRFIGAEMNASGVYDNVTKNKTGFLIFNRGSYVQYLRRGILVETDKDIASGAIEMVATLRSVVASPDASTAKNVVWSYNWAS